MDFGAEVVGIVSGPFWLHWHDGERKRRHAPDYFTGLLAGLLRTPRRRLGGGRRCRR
ncbi:MULTISPECIES: hypothetical protein [unclassified Streptomyces]|uniref:hypothetical protein n=1 Tax=unclassified Streptomyces TaxID=2593676 RepID=UPI0038187071